MGAGTLGATGGEATHVLTAAELAAHTHTATQPAHGHAATQAAHAHAIATGSHAHGITTGGHSHSLTAQVLTPNGGGNATAGSGWAFTSPTTSAVGNLGGNTDTAGNLGGNTDTQAPAITVPAAQPAITVANTGGGAAHNNLPPFLSVNFIIRYQ
jgi:microcystin-dependent protein